MIQIVDVDERITMDDYEMITHLSNAVTELKHVARSTTPVLRDRTIWMINSTAQGGGVAEMLPRMISLFNELGVDTKWAVIQTDNKDFFTITKRIHNLIHDSGEPYLSDEDRKVYEAVNRENADSLKKLIKPRDILIIHDPQPMALGSMIKKELGNPVIWRSHIGLDEHTRRTSTVWRFLLPYAEDYDFGVFTAPEYIPSYFATRASIIHPSIDPLNHKNRDLSPVKTMGILCNAGLARAHNPVLYPDFSAKALRLQKDGTFAQALIPDEIGLLYRPIISQISRWDKLKGFEPLLNAFAILKDKLNDSNPIQDERHKRRLEITRLVLAGPDPASIQDDPEGQEVLESLKAKYLSLPERIQNDVVLLALPMGSRKENALMVNVIQRSSSIIVQNSLREGFGLTATEGMWKRKPVLISNACGLRQQVREGVEGAIVYDPQDPVEIAGRLNEILSDPYLRDYQGQKAQRRVHDNFLVFSQVRKWLEVLSTVIRKM